MYEFTGRTEREAIERASEALELASNQFDVEILESEGGFFRKGHVRIRAYPHSEDQVAQLEDCEPDTHEQELLSEWRPLVKPEAWQQRVGDFMQQLLQQMGQDGSVHLLARPDDHLLLSVQDSSNPSQLIGKHGKHLEALQVVLNAYLGRLQDEDGEGNFRAQVDVGDYRRRREAKLLRLAQQIATQVENSRSSRLLEAMNPFERRIVHKALNEWNNISTVSEGEGLYKQVRIIYQGSNH